MTQKRLTETADRLEAVLRNVLDTATVDPLIAETLLQALADYRAAILERVTEIVYSVYRVQNDGN